MRIRNGATLVAAAASLMPVTMIYSWARFGALNALRLGFLLGRTASLRSSRNCSRMTRMNWSRRSRHFRSSSPRRSRALPSHFPRRSGRDVSATMVVRAEAVPRRSYSVQLEALQLPY